MTRRPRVMIVDDEPSVLQALGRALAGEPYEVTTTSDPTEAGRALRAGGVDLLLVDFKMPGMNGGELLAQAARTSPGTIRMLLTGYPGEDLASSGGPPPAAVLQKPWDNESLRRTLREALAGRGLDEGPASAR